MVAPLYALARSGLPARSAWASAAIWPVVPSAILFHPTADTVFPLISTLALALAARGRPIPAFLAGVALGLGMQMTLAFLAVGLAVGIVIAGRAGPIRSRVVGLLATGLGFLGITLAVWAISRANPFEIWWWNARNHGRFYVEHPRSYFPWLAANVLELAVAMGLPAFAWAVVGLAGTGRPRGAVAVAAVVLILEVSGKNRSEVARLWLPFLPGLLAASGAGIGRLGGGKVALGLTVLLVGLGTMALQATLQVVYPV